MKQCPHRTGVKNWLAWPPTQLLGPANADFNIGVAALELELFQFAAQKDLVRGITSQCQRDFADANTASVRWRDLYTSSAGSGLSSMHNSVLTRTSGRG